MFLTHLVIAFAAAFVYCSFLEWVLHKHFMHSTRFMREPFERHAVQHHGMHRSCRSFFADLRERPQYMLIGASFCPILWLLHLPVFAAVEYFVARGAGVGVGLGTACYCLCYEIIHWSEHVPRNRWFERTRWFQFLLEHHRVHHKYARKNYNVVLPLADLLFGTLTLERLPPEPAEPVIPERIKSWLGGGSRMGQKPGRRNPALAGHAGESAED
jgi:sterol desaturase/sphingolipid hydroxylase (fatty acid hydroxylase superfamily)